MWVSAMQVSKWLFISLLLSSDLALATPTFSEVKQQYQPSERWLLARDGQVIQQVRTNMTVRRLAWVPLEEMSPALLQALLFSEDKRFYEHSGIDWKAVAAASWRNVWNNKTRGASTITMQLAGLLTEDAVQHRRTVIEKLSQSGDALLLDQRWKKSEILEAYLNLVPFRGELQGVSAMSFGLFHKAPNALNTRESAIAAVLLRSPNAKPARVAERACVLLKQMGKPAQCNDVEGEVALKLIAPFDIARINVAPHLARTVLQSPDYSPKPSGKSTTPYASNQSIATTLDLHLQQYAAMQLRANLLQLNYQNVHDGAVLVLDNATGEVLAWVGSSGNLSENPEVDYVLAPRQAGSTLKPFLYATAIQMRSLTAASILDDSPVRINTSGGYYIPQNYDKHFMGPVSVRKALGNSLNVPAVRTLLRITPDKFYAQLQQLHFTTLTEPVDFYGYSLALGGLDVRLLDLTNAYRAFANQGQYSDVHWLLPKQQGRSSQSNKPDKLSFSTRYKPVFEPQAASIVANILSDNNARLHTFGMDSALNTRYWSAVKTGTSKDMRDNWCIGFSGRYTVGVWVGNADGQPMHDVSGVTGAAPVWRAVMDYLHRQPDGRPVQTDALKMAAGVSQRAIHFEPAIEPPRTEWFLAETEQTTIKANSEMLANRPYDAAISKALNPSTDEAVERNRPVSINYPGEGAIVAIDPELPLQQQRMVFKANTPIGKGWQWLVDQQTVQMAHGKAAWFPMPGHHTLELQNQHQQTVDTVHFEVRGALLKASLPQRPK